MGPPGVEIYIELLMTASTGADIPQCQPFHFVLSPALQGVERGASNLLNFFVGALVVPACQCCPSLFASHFFGCFVIPMSSILNAAILAGDMCCATEKRLKDSSE